MSLRIAVLAHNHFPIAEPYAGGLEAHTALVADELVRRGHEVTLFAKGGSRSLARVHPVVPRTFDARRPDPTGRTDEVADRGMQRAAAAIGPGPYDVILNNSLNPVPYTAYERWPMLTLLHTPATMPRVNAVVSQPGWRPGRRHAFAAVSETTAADWRRRLGPTPVLAIHNGIDLARWAAPADAAPPRPRVAVWAARVTPEKGLPLAIAAARAAGFALEFCGPVSDQQHWDRDVEPLLGPDVRYRGHLDHDALPAFLRSGSVFVSSPQWEEPFGLSLLEALSAGTPAAAQRRGAAAEIVGAAGGVLAADLSVAALADAITAAAGLDRTQVRRSVERFDTAAMVDAYERVLTGLVASVPVAEAFDLDVEVA